ncbi:MAG: sporulation protein Cse60 [Vagococcus fluvialis]
MRIQVEIFNDNNMDRLQKCMNEFLSKVELVDIKYSTCISSEAYGEEIDYSALVIYKKEV